MERDFDCIRQMRLWMIVINNCFARRIRAYRCKKEVVEGKAACLILLSLEEQKKLLALTGKVAQTSSKTKKIF
jgi:hypothetical protein